MCILKKGIISNTEAGGLYDVRDIHDLTERPNKIDATVYYDIVDWFSSHDYFYLTYNEVQKLINGKPINKHVILILTKEKLDKLYNIINEMILDDLIEDKYVARYFTETEIRLLNLIYRICVYKDDTVFVQYNEDEIEPYDVEPIYYRIWHAIEYLKEIYYSKADKEAYFDTYPNNKTKKRSLSVGDIIEGEKCSIEITRVYALKDPYHHKLYDGINTITKEVYTKKRARDFKRIVNNDFPIATVNGISMTLQKWSKKLGLDKYTLRAHYYRNGNDIKAVERLIAHHLKRLEENKSKYYTRDMINRR